MQRRLLTDVNVEAFRVLAPDSGAYINEVRLRASSHSLPLRSHFRLLPATPSIAQCTELT